jgi:hypothetical protein
MNEEVQQERARLYSIAIYWLRRKQLARRQFNLSKFAHHWDNKARLAHEGALRAFSEAFDNARREFAGHGRQDV